MLVSELITKLQALPQDAIVLTKGYESGYDAAETTNHVMVHEVVDTSWYDGKYDYNWMEHDGVVDNISAVIIDRGVGE